jgi:IS5 family transposase
MKPRSSPDPSQDDLFKTRLEAFINPKHPLVRLTREMDWDAIEGQVAPLFADEGCPAVPSRFMVGILILKAVYDLSDEDVFERWVYDPYFQHFTGEVFFQHKAPHERSGLSHWRKRLGPDFVDTLIQESLRIAHGSGALKGRDLERVTVDTTVQPKNVKFPTDAGLLYTALKALGVEARRAGIKLRQSYVRVGKTAQIKAGRYAHAKQWRRHRREIKFLRTRLGRVRRDIERAIIQRPGLRARFAEPLRKARIIEAQVLNARAPVKLYSWHAPETECIGKGKARQPYEFGCKATFTVTNRRTRAGMFVLHADALHGRPHDGHTLGGVLEQTTDLTGVTPLRAYVDKGYKGHKQNQYRFKPGTRQTVRPPWRVFMSGRKALKPSIARELKRRSAIEPVIGHAKHGHRMERNYLKGRHGDRFNAKMAAAGFNFSRLLDWFAILLCQILKAVIRKIRLPSTLNPAF